MDFQTWLSREWCAECLLLVPKLCQVPFPPMDDRLPGNVVVAGGELMWTTWEQAIMVDEVGCAWDLEGWVGTGWREGEGKALVAWECKQCPEHPSFISRTFHRCQCGQFQSHEDGDTLAMTLMKVKIYNFIKFAKSSSTPFDFLFSLTSPIHPPFSFRFRGHPSGPEWSGGAAFGKVGWENP